jgi:hypothetical protein
LVGDGRSFDCLQWLRKQPPLALIFATVALLLAFTIARFIRRRRRPALIKTTDGGGPPVETAASLKEQLRLRLAEAPALLTGPVIRCSDHGCAPGL